MKGISMLLTATLLLAAHLLALHLKGSGSLPSNRESEKLSALKETGPARASVPQVQI